MLKYHECSDLGAKRVEKQDLVVDRLLACHQLLVLLGELEGCIFQLCG